MKEKTFAQDRQRSDRQTQPRESVAPQGEQTPLATQGQEQSHGDALGQENTWIAAMRGDPQAIDSLYAVMGHGATQMLLQGPQPLARFNPDVAAKLKKSTGVDVGDATVAVDPGLAEQGHQGAAESGQRIYISHVCKDQERTLCHEGIHIVQGRGGSPGAQRQSRRDVEAEAVDGVQQVTSGETFLVTQSIGPERHYQDEPSPSGGVAPELGGSTGTAAVPLADTMHNAAADAAKRANYKKKLGKKEVLSELFAKPHLEGASRFWSEKEVEFTAKPPGPGELKAFGDNLVDIIIISDMNLTLEEKKAKELNGVDVPNVFDEKAFETFTSNPVGAMLNPRSLLDKGFVKSPKATIQKRERAFDRIHEITSQMIFRTERQLTERQRHYRKLLDNLWDSSAQDQITMALMGSEDSAFQVGLKHVTGDNDKGPEGTLCDIRHAPSGPEQKELQRRLQEGGPLIEQLTAGKISATASALQSAVDTLMLQGAQEASAQMQAMKHVVKSLSSQLDDVGNLTGGSHYRNPLHQGNGFLDKLGKLPDGVSSIRDDNDVTDLKSRPTPSAANKKASDFLARYCYAVSPAAKDPTNPTPEELIPNAEMRAFQRTRVMGAGHGKTAPHLSRHHWGTDFDFSPIASAPYEAPGTEANRFEWMDRFARYFGFFQPYKGNPVVRPTQAHAKLDQSDSRDKNTREVIGILEEKWHWSYFPVAEAYRGFIEAHAGDFERFLRGRLTEYEKDLQKGLPGIPDLYSWIKDHWSILHNNIQVDFEPNDEIASYLPIKEE